MWIVAPNIKFKTHHLVKKASLLWGKDSLNPDLGEFLWEKMKI
jgi:hypothetical protein